MKNLLFIYCMPSDSIIYQELHFRHSFWTKISFIMSLVKYILIFVDCVVSYGISSLKIFISQHQLIILSYCLLSYVDCQKKQSITSMIIPSAFHILTHLNSPNNLRNYYPHFSVSKVSQSALLKVTEPVRTEPKLEPSQS